MIFSGLVHIFFVIIFSCWIFAYTVYFEEVAPYKLIQTVCEMCTVNPSLYLVTYLYSLQQNSVFTKSESNAHAVFPFTFSL